MPSKKKKYNARFPAGRIKKIMQTDEEVGKVAQAVPVIIYILLINIGTFYLVKNIPDASVQEDNENNDIFDENLDKTDGDSDGAGNSMDVVTSPETSSPPIQIAANFYNEQSTSTSRTPVIQYGPKIAQTESTRLNFSVNSLLGQKEEPKLHTTIASEQLPVPQLVSTNRSTNSVPPKVPTSDNIPPLIPISHLYSQNTGDNLCIDEDYDN
ncbi:hypothetical protein NQ314_005492 [Rhamnusium bicolor]|uniref:Transcription factor CBF/NF-Y/archaeal histone domain-containing protein n=1 Tax=Rhamnusium bicolor TaxID=1586634 RepID=A0AAV8ZGF2_9CUCU|nr:hypothetical protein NQ314_005492 [Rhamnusium bicolor]